MNIDLGYIAAVAAIVVALVEIVKRIPALMKAEWCFPLFSIAFGLLVMIPAVAIWPPEMAAGTSKIAWVSLHGLVAGLSAAGLYSAGAKYVTKLLP